MVIFCTINYSKGTCGGTILNEDTILSAAHCFIDEDSGATNKPYDVGDFIVAGITNRKNLGAAGAQRIRIKNITVHPFFNYNTFPKRDFDYSIVKLFKPLSFNTNVKPACLPRANLVVPGNVTVLASGWGKLLNGKFSFDFPL